MIEHHSKLQANIGHMIHQVENVIKRAGAEQDKRHPTVVADEHWGSLRVFVWCTFTLVDLIATWTAFALVTGRCSKF